MSLLLSSFPVLSTAVDATAQVAPNPYDTVAVARDSGALANHDVVHRVVWRQRVRVDGANWLRLVFDRDSTLERDTFVTLTSLQDQNVQFFEAWSLRDYGGMSAGFNGDSVDIELWAGPGTMHNRLSLVAVEAGRPFSVGIQSQCGPTDDRVPSTDPRQARQFPTGCTTWLISKFAGLTAGHCTSNTAQQMHFNCPPSSSTGSIVLPAPSDQYPYDVSSVRRLNNGVGQDWTAFATVRNSNTGLYPGEKQGSWYELGTPVSSTTIRITGYGVDRDQRNRSQTQQTHTGPLATYSSSQTRLCYVVDTEGGNSGSPVIDDRTGKAIGIHTHGGCSTSGSGCNSGTAINRTDLQAAIQAVLQSRVAGAFESVGVGCNGSNGVPQLDALGTPDIGSNFVLSGKGLALNAAAILSFGLSKTSWLSVPLPISLTNAGATGCSITSSIDATEGVVSTTGLWSRNINLPNDKTWIGARFYFQWIGLDKAANSLGITTSNSLGVEVGGIR
ncbi:MAG: trypsin-like serine protease [Planctomycetes bacterium]|nr:trypsin-like serine protease [Planctomycetota bacterium]MCB9918479.1 trypsin-like serine protease [Planctomycetota bacterium]